MRIREHSTRPQDPPFALTNIGRALLYDDRQAIVSSVSAGEYGERVTFEVGGATITTTPGLDPRFAWV